MRKAYGKQLNKLHTERALLKSKVRPLGDQIIEIQNRMQTLENKRLYLENEKTKREELEKQFLQMQSMMN